MTAGLLASKLYIPPTRLDLVQRPHILESLDAGLSGKLTLVSAPAGFGKTTLVSEWIRSCGLPTAWLSLDNNDNNLARFLIYLIAALQRIDPQIGGTIQATLEESLSPKFDILLTKLVSEIEGLPEKSIIVLDDVHLIDSKPVYDAINFLVEYLPPNIHLVISGRTDPPLPISRLRVQGQLTEVRTSSLRFTAQEIGIFLNDLKGFDLSAEGIAALETRTEGWIASLKLASISMHGRQDWPEFIAEFSGSHRYVIDYLVDEVMARQSEEVKTFLSRTSILERFCLPLCESVVGERVDPHIIDYLDRSNLFLIPLDDHREWYRYHHLFANFLSQRLRETEPDRIPELHRRASEWFQSQGLLDEAIQHALASDDVDRAIRLVDQVAVDFVVRREPKKLLKLMDQLPPERCQDYPLLCLLQAWALLFLGQLDAVEPIVQIVEANQDKAPGIPLPGYVSTVRAYLANMQGDVLKSTNLTEVALEEMSQAPPDRMTLIFQGSAVIWLGINYRTLGNLGKASQLFTKAADLNQKAGNFYAALASFEQLARLEVQHGNLRQAKEIYQSGLKLAENWLEEEGRPRGSLIASAGPQLGLGMVLYQMNDLVGAAACIQHSADLLELGELWLSTDAYRMLAYIAQANGDFETSAELLSKAWAIDDSLHFRQINTSDPPSMAQLGILLSRLRPDMAHLVTDASRRIESRGVHAGDEVDFSSPTGYPRELFYADLARVLIAQGRAAEALPLLTRLLAAAITMERFGDAIRYLTLVSLAHQELGNTRPALDTLRRALTLAEPQGYVRLFIDEGFAMAELLGLAISQNIAVDYASKLLAAFPTNVLSQVPAAQGFTALSQSLDEPLSQREIEVLRLMAEGYKYQEIADLLVVSINTVRHHTKNVYGKLGANNRTQAIARANEMNLL